MFRMTGVSIPVTVGLSNTANRFPKIISIYGSFAQLVDPQLRNTALKDAST
jgi:hypothetical protein